MYDIILGFITAFTLTYIAIPSIIKVATKKHLYDEPDERKAHSSSVPTLGGIAIFAGVIFSTILWTPFTVFGDLQYILCAFIILFLIGAKDDIDPVPAYKKLAGQVFASFILVFKAQVTLTSLYGIFGIYEIPYVVSITLSMFTIIVIINAFNLIDGINGLSGSIGALIALAFGSWFYVTDQIELSILAFALVGSLFAFLKYNITPAKIFMGDTGSLFVGCICAILAIRFIEINSDLGRSPYNFKAVPAVAIAVLILPLFDTLRVFTMRILRGRSPMHADRNHIHHLLLDTGLTHMQATGVLVVVNILFILLAIRFQGLGSLNLLLLVVGIAAVLSLALYAYVRKKRLRLKAEKSS